MSEKEDKVRELLENYVLQLSADFGKLDVRLANTSNYARIPSLIKKLRAYLTSPQASRAIDISLINVIGPLASTLADQVASPSPGSPIPSSNAIPQLTAMVSRDLESLNFRSKVEQMSENERLAESNRINEELTSKLKEAELNKAEQSHQLNEMNRKLAEFEVERQKQLAQLGTLDYVTECNTAIAYHQNHSKWSLIGFVAVASVVFIFLLLAALGVGGLFVLPPHPDVWDFVSQATGKIIITTFLIGLCVIVSRVYFAHQHNIVSIRHQRLAALAFHKFLGALPPEEKEGRHNIIVQCVTAICQREASGFIKDGQGNSNAYKEAYKEGLNALKK